MNKTVESMRSAINFSMKKTMFRNNEFDDDPEKKAEIMDTLAALSAMHKLLDEFVEHNESIFK